MSRTVSDTRPDEPTEPPPEDDHAFFGQPRTLMIPSGLSDGRIRLHRPVLGWDVEITTRSEITCDTADFITSDEVTCREAGETVFHRTWEKRIPRVTG